MKIINAKQIIPPSRTINGVEIFFYENSNIIDNQIILCGHEKKDEHKTTKLYYHVIGTNIYEMILKDWCDSYKHGLEDAHINIVKTAQGYYYLSAESKPYHQGTGNINIETFKSKNLRTGWQWCPNLTIKPTSRSFENYSMSSPVNYYLGNNELLQMFECRGLKGTPDSWWIDGQYYAKVSYAIFDTTTDTIKRRATQPISNVNAVPDDLWFEDGWWKHSWHTHDKTDGWFGFVYKSREFDKGLVFDYKATLDGKTIGEIYFTNSNKVRFWHSNQQGMWEGILSQGTPPIPPIGEDMKPIIVLENDKLKVTNSQVGANYAWQSIDLNGKVEWFAFGTEVDVIKKDGWQFFCYPMPDGSNQSNYVTYGEVVIIEPDPDPEPTDTVEVNKEVLEAIKSHSEHVIFLINEELK